MKDTGMKNARTPPLISTGDAAKSMNLSKENCVNIIKTLRRKRRPFMDRWKEIRDYQLPYIGDLDEGTPEEDRFAKRRDTHIYNSVAWESNKVFAAGIMSGLTPQSRQWFRLGFTNDALASYAEAAKLLDKRMDILSDVLNKSNFYNAIHACYLELAFGQAPLGIFPSAETGVHYIPFTIGSYMYDVDANGQVNVFAREYWLTTEQLAEQFGKENLPYSLQVELEKGGSAGQKHKVYWLVKKNEAEDRRHIDRFSMPFISVYWLEEAEKNEWLYIGGFEEWPIPVGRFIVPGTEAYAQGPGWYSEGDSKGLQLLEKDYLQAVELGVKPPMQSDTDTARRGISLVPGGNTVTKGGHPVTPLFQVQLDLQHLQQKILDHEDRIKRNYSADLFLMLDAMEDKRMTAREVMERSQEKMQQLGPVVQRLQFEFLSKIIERTYAILDRANMFPMPEDPELAMAIEQEEIKIEYISPLAQAQKLSGLVNIEQLIAFVGNAAQFDPAALDKLDFVKAVDVYAERLGAPASIKRGEEEFQKLQQQKREEAARMQEMQQAAAAAQIAAPAAQAAKNATEAAQAGNPALAQLLGMEGMGTGGNA